MPVTVVEAGSGVTSIFWNTNIKRNVTRYHTNEKVRIDSFHPCVGHVVRCHLYSSPIVNKTDKYEIQIFLVLHRQQPLLAGSSFDGGTRGNPGSPTLPFAIWGSVGGCEKFKLNEAKKLETKQWASKKINFKFCRSTKGNSIPVTCQFWVEFETFSHSEKNTLNQLKDLYVQQTNCDVQFHFREQEHIGAHATILAARSPVFAAMFQHNMQEAVMGEVYIEDIPSDIFDQLLHYIYSGKPLKPITEATVQPIYMAADKYCIDDLKEDCVQFLSSCVRMSNVLNLMIWSHNYSVKKVKETAISFVAKHGKEICNLRSWERLTKSYPELSVLATRRMMDYMQR